jgi:hypothetical protein
LIIICNRCKEEHAEAMGMANAHMDAQGIPENSVMRGLADIQIACQAHPILSMIMKRCWPTTETLLESPVHQNQI